MPDVRMPDGAIVRFPDEMPADQIRSIIATKFPDVAESDASRKTRSELSGMTQNFSRDRTDGIGRNVDSFMRGAADTLTFGLADELSALGQSTVDAMTGTPDNYDRRLNQQRITQKIRDQRDPIASTAGRIAGGVTGGVGLAKSGATLTGRLAENAGLGAKMLAGAGEGAAYGGLYGFGSGEGVVDRATDAAGGAAMGGLIGGAVPAVVEGAKAVARPIRDALQARTNPGEYASRKVAERLSTSNLTPETVATRMEANPGMAVADVSGKSARDLLRTTTNIPGPAKDRVTKQLVMRQFGQGDRIKSAIAKTFSDPDGYLSAKDDLAQAAQQMARPAYEKAYQNPVHFSETLEEVLKTPAGQTALRNAQQLAANEQEPFRQVFINIRGEARRVPDTRGWDYIKRAMDDMIDGQKNAITGKLSNEGRILTNLKNRMLAEVDKFNPDYKQARSIFGGIAQIDDAMEMGRDAFSMSPEALRRAVKDLSPAQKAAARIGAAERMRDQIDKTGWTNNAVLKIFNNRQSVANLRTLFDNNEQFAEFRRAIFNEAKKRSTYDAVRGNSTTASQLADMMEAGGLSDQVGTIETLARSGPVSATLQWVGSRLKALGGLTPKTADEIAKRLMATSPEQMRQVVSELKRIQSANVSAAEKTRLVEMMLSRSTTIPAVEAISGRN